MRDMRPADVANRIRALPLEKRQRLAEIIEDDRLADLLEELPEDEQIRLISGLDLERAADILEEMDPDDAADLLGEMSAEERARLLGAMEPDEATHVRRLLIYEAATAGGLMTPEPVIMSRDGRRWPRRWRCSGRRRFPIALAAQVFVVQPAPVGADRPLPRHHRLPAPAAPPPVGDPRRHRPGPLRVPQPRDARARGRRPPRRLRHGGGRGVRLRRATWSARSPSTT